MEMVISLVLVASVRVASFKMWKMITSGGTVGPGTVSTISQALSYTTAAAAWFTSGLLLTLYVSPHISFSVSSHGPGDGVAMLPGAS